MAQWELYTKRSFKAWTLTKRPIYVVESWARKAKYVLRTMGVPDDFLLAAKMVGFGPHVTYEPHSKYTASYMLRGSSYLSRLLRNAPTQ